MKAKKLRFLILPFLILILIVVAGCLCSSIYLSVEYTSSVSDETTKQLSNPYRGFLYMKGYLLSDDTPVTEETLAEVNTLSPDNRLQMLQININQYQNRPLSSSALQQLDMIFRAWSAADKQLIVRFLYDWNGKALETEPDSVELILEHMEQLGPIINRYASHIYILQGVFLGNCGEMHSSKHMDHMTTLLQKLAEVTDPSIFLSVRTPQHWRIANNVLDCPSPFPAFSGSLCARLGLFNDGMLGSGNDVGTYGETPRSEATDPSYKGTRSDELQFQNELCHYVPNGGETTLNSKESNPENALHDLSLMHVSYLSAAYTTDAFQKWMAATYEGNNCFSGLSYFDYIAAHLGYRYVLRDSSLQFSTWKDTDALLSFKIENVGFASSLKPFSVSISMYNNDTEEFYSFPCDLDIRLLQSGKTENYDICIPIRDCTPGCYDVRLHMTDPVTGETIQLANACDTPDEGYTLGTLTIQ